jgi:hypothetical protein
MCGVRGHLELLSRFGSSFVGSDLLLLVILFRLQTVRYSSGAWADLGRFHGSFRNMLGNLMNRWVATFEPGSHWHGMVKDRKIGPPGFAWGMADATPGRDPFR